MLGGVSAGVGLGLLLGWSLLHGPAPEPDASRLSTTEVSLRGTTTELETEEPLFSTGLPDPLVSPAPTGRTRISAHRAAVITLAEGEGWHFEVAVLSLLCAPFILRRVWSWCFPKPEPLRPVVWRRDGRGSAGSVGARQQAARAVRE